MVLRSATPGRRPTSRSSDRLLPDERGQNTDAYYGLRRATGIDYPDGTADVSLHPCFQRKSRQDNGRDKSGQLDACCVQHSGSQVDLSMAVTESCAWICDDLRLSNGAVISLPSRVDYTTSSEV